MVGEQERRAPKRRAAVLAVLVLLVLLAAVALVVLGAGPDSDDAEAAEHPPIEPSQSCTSCKALGHDHTHLEPYTGPCERCHTTSSWRIVHYEHGNRDFDVSIHAAIGCAKCHTEGELPLSPACETCHAAKSPHGVGELACGMCHTVVAWPLLKGLPSDHLSLEGGHALLSCFECHTEVRDPDAPDRGCVDCHGTNHGGLTACEDCHDPARGWDPVPGFDHSAFFPLTGPHDVTCTRCHDAGTTSTFNCLGCHERGETDDEHDEVSGDSYSSPACYLCHPTGRGD